MEQNDLLSKLKKNKKTKQVNNELEIQGDVLSHGLAIGRAFFYKVPQSGVIKQTKEICIEEEKEKIKDGIAKLQDSIGELLSETAIMLTEESLDIFEVYRLIVQDNMFEKELNRIVETGKTAYEATEIVAQKFKKKMHSDSFWQTRLYDMQYILRQLRSFINDEKEEDETIIIDNHPVILIANYISPADLLYYYRYRRVVGLILKDNGQTSHSAIVARSLRIPSIGGINLTSSMCKNNATMLIDTSSKSLFIRPTENTLSKIQKKRGISQVKKDDSVLTTITKDNVKIDLYINANIKEELSVLNSPIINGVGLFRTEILFMLPDVATDFYAQSEEYKNILNMAGEKPVIFRTIDMTDDKDIDIFEEEFSEQKLPAAQKAPLKEPLQFSNHLVLATQTGKILSSRHEIIKTQIRALLRARIISDRPNDPINIMIPMISDAMELHTYQKIIEAEAMHMSHLSHGIVSQIKIGAMIEVPSLVYQINKISPLVDFVSIGTNDLFQFFFATDRWDAKSKMSQDVLSPAFLKFIGSIVYKLEKNSVSTHVCGEMAANPLSAMALLSLGIRKLSVSPGAVNQIASMINSLSLGLLYPYMRAFRNEPYELCVSSGEQYRSSLDVRNTLQNFAAKHKVQI